MSYDLAFLGNPENLKTALAIDNKADDGLYKLLQRIIILLFSDIDSQYNMGIGTTLPQEVFSANIVDPQVIQGVFNNSMAKVRQYLKDNTPASAPLDEQLKDAQVIIPQLGDVQTDTQEVQIIVTSAAEGTISVRVPISEIFDVEETDGNT